MEGLGQDVEQFGVDIQDAATNVPEGVVLDQGTGATIGSLFGPIGGVLGGLVGLVAERKRRQAKAALAQTVRGIEAATNTGNIKESLSQHQDLATKQLVGQLRAS